MIEDARKSVRITNILRLMLVYNEEDRVNSAQLKEIVNKYFNSNLFVFI